MSYEDSYLMHHGVKGMHWGVRRYRNYDGTLTDAGKAQRRAQNSSSSGGSRKSSAGGRGGMSAQTKKRLATAAKVAGAAAAVGGAAYLANRASGGKLAEAGKNAAANAKFNARYAKEYAKDQFDRAADTKAGLAVRKSARRVGDTVKNKYNNSPNLKYDVESIRSAASTAGSRVGKAARRVGDTVSDKTANARNRLANTRAGKAYDDFRATGGVKAHGKEALSSVRTRAGKTAKRVGDTISDKTANARNRLANTRAGKAYDDFRATGGVKTHGREALSSARTKGKEALSSVKTKAGKASKLAGDTISDKTADARNRLANTRAGKAYDDFRATGGIKTHGREALSSARTKAGKAVGRVGDTISDKTANARNRLANTRAGKAYDDFRAQGGVRGAIANRKEAANKGKTSARRVAGELNKSADVRAYRAVKSAPGAIKGAASNARSKAGSALSTAGKAVKSGASNARSATGKVIRRAGDTISDKTADTRNRLANTRAGKAYDDFRATGGLKARGKEAVAKAKSGGSYLKSRASGGVVNTRSRNNDFNTRNADAVSRLNRARAAYKNHEDRSKWK